MSSRRPSFPRTRRPGLRAAIERSLRPDPEDRPSSAAEFAHLLDDGDGADDATVVIPRAAPRRRRISPLPVIAAAAVLFALAAVGLALATRDDDPNQPAAPAQVQTIPDGATPSEDARGLADWLRENAR